VWTGSSDSKQGPVTGCRRHSREILNSVKDGKFLLAEERLQLAKKKCFCRRRRRFCCCGGAEDFTKHVRYSLRFHL